MKKFKVLSVFLVLIIGMFCFTACKNNDDEQSNDNRIVVEVLSDSMYPAISTGDKIVIEPKDNYVTGDIVMFNLQPNLNVTHRIIGIFEEDDVTYYICHGDNVQNVDGSDSNADWRDDADYVQNLISENKTKAEIEDECGPIINIITFQQIRGAVVKVIRV